MERPSRAVLPRSAAHVLIAVAWLYSGAHFVRTAILNAIPNKYGDFLAAFPSWRVASLAGRTDLWTGSVAQKWCWGEPRIWHYGPLLHLFTLPLFAFPTLRSAYLAWLLVTLVIVVATIALLTRLIDHGSPTLATVTVVIVVVLNLNPLYEGIIQRVVEIVELFLLVAAYTAHRRGRDFAAGLLVGVAAMTKFLPLIFLPYFALKKNWKALAGALVAVVPVAIVTEPILGWRYSGILIQLQQGSYHKGVGDPSLPGLAIAFLAPILPVSMVAIGRGAIVAGLVAVCALFLRTRRCTGEREEELEWATLCTAMVLLPPHAQDYYLLFLAFGFLPAMRLVRFDPRRLGSPAGVAFIAAFLLSAAPIPFSWLAPWAGPSVFKRYLASGLPSAGAILLVVTYAALLLRSSSGGPAPTSARRVHFGGVEQQQCLPKTPPSRRLRRS